LDEVLVKHQPPEPAHARRGPIVLLVVSLTVELAWVALLGYVLYHVF
jgi:hypothetical protein